MSTNMIALVAIAAILLPPALSGCPYMQANQNRKLNNGNYKSSITDINIGTVYLTNDDFKEGTYRITQPGKYVLQEDISFAPNSASSATIFSDVNDIVDCCKPRHDQFESNGGTYPDFPFALGFFAAITIESDEVEIDLNNHIIEQSKEHALMQRFFAVIELASTPFIPTQGPTNFGDEITSGKRIYIHDGTIGRSSHHGIHGNGNRQVRITNVDFKDFEVAAVALNGVEGLKLDHCTAKNREDVPVMGIFSSALFIHRYIQALDDTKTRTTLKVQGQVKTVTDIRTELEKSIANVYKDIVKKNRSYINKNTHPDEYALFHNPHGVIDGNAYGFVTNSLGHATGGFPSSTNGKVEHAQDVVFEDVTVLSLKAAISEVIALRLGDSDEAVNDPLGAIFQVRNAHPDDPNQPVTISTLQNDYRAEYTGNVVANAQLFVAKCILNGEVPDDDFLPTQTNKINQQIINWAEAGGTTKAKRRLSKLLGILAPGKSGFFCNGDSMFHVNKGTIGFKIDSTNDITMKYCDVYNMENLGEAGSKVCGNYDKSHPGSTYPGYGGANARGFSFSGSRRANIYKCFVANLVSTAGLVVGYDVHTNSEGIILNDCHENGLEALGKGGPNSLTPRDACGLMFRESTKNCVLMNHCFSLPVSVGGIAEEVRNDGIGNLVTDEICLIDRNGGN